MLVTYCLQTQILGYKMKTSQRKQNNTKELPPTEPSVGENRSLAYRIFKYICFKYANISEKMISSFLAFLVPFYYVILLVIVKPTLVKYYEPSMSRQIFESLLSLFGYVNIFGNFLLGVYTDTTLKNSAFPALDSEDSVDYCEECKLSRPSQAWHCKLCNACILRRDHHCVTFSCCIGLRNIRYFLLYIVYVMVSMVYLNIYMYLYLMAICGSECGISYAPVDIIYGVVLFLVLWGFLGGTRSFVADIFRWGWEMKLIMFLWKMNFFFFFWALGTFIYHGRNAYRGLTMWEANSGKTANKDVLYNVRRVFGIRWYWAIIWPFAYSPLPDDLARIKQV